jgi:hypothetical protein
MVLELWGKDKESFGFFSFSPYKIKKSIFAT